MKKDSLVVVFTGENKGKTSAALGLLARALGAGQRVCWASFIKSWPVSEDKFFERIQPVFGERLEFYKGGKGFYKAGDLSAAGVSEAEHQRAAQETYDLALAAATSGDWDLVICDEINNAAADGLLPPEKLKELIERRMGRTSLCLTGRSFPDELLPLVDIATEMKKLKHHFDDGFVAMEGIDF
ncbi:MAG: cob(I)yrinic acid a,c-diamide adenosyltransferase [Candidatus Nomurabacteria bacterium]|jgi:cob(I)alamin adenosyltransferase|nr:cob(I)yrinic acid a,c-diamide adenosyltransferase [Candidatus Nomurabacteria bacterium]